MSNKEVLSQTADVRLSLSDWLLLLGWCSAHLSDTSPVQVIASMTEISKQVAA